MQSYKYYITVEFSISYEDLILRNDPFVAIATKNIIQKKILPNTIMITNEYSWKNMIIRAENNIAIRKVPRTFPSLQR